MCKVIFTLYSTIHIQYTILYTYYIQYTIHIQYMQLLYSPNLEEDLRPSLVLELQVAVNCHLVIHIEPKSLEE